MPILPAEPDSYPPDLWQDESVWTGGNGRWWCLHTKPRQEKATARDLRSQGIAHYLPMVAQEDVTPQGRRTWSILPLFSGYLFLLGNEQDRLAALKGNRLVRVLDVADQAAMIHDLRQIHQLIASGLQIEPESGPPIGTMIRILSGPLAGIEGQVIRRGKGYDFVAAVRFLGSGATVRLEDWQVERIDD